MQVCRFKEENSFLNEFIDNHQQNLNHQSLEKYYENNKYFSISKIIFNENEQVIGYNCIYKYDNKHVQLEHYLSNGIWKILPHQFDLKEQEKLNILLDDLNNQRNLSFHQQVEIITTRFQHHFHELNQNEILLSTIPKEDDGEIKYSNTNHTSPPSTNLEIDEEQIHCPLQFLSPDVRQVTKSSTPTSTSRRIRQDSSCSSTNSIRYTQFVPPSMTTVRRRRVVQSILLRVQRKKQVLEKVLDTLKSPPSMYELGLEFLRNYDGKFNYPEGHTFAINFAKRTWFLTIENIKCVECQLNESEPRSVLILKYKDKFTNVQV